MNEQMTKIPSSGALSTSILSEDGTSDGITAKFAEPQKPVLSNGQLDNRIKKTVPIKSASITTLPKSQAAQQPESSPLPTHNMTRLNMLNAGKAVPFTKQNVKQYADFKVKATNGFVNTAYGPLCKMECTSVKSPSNVFWEFFIGSPVVNFCLSAKYALICSCDGSIRFVDIKTGVLVLPALKLFTPAVQCVFVSSNCFIKNLV